MQIIQSKSAAVLNGIIALQTINLEANITAQERQSQGFITVQHHVALLEQICGNYPHVVALNTQQKVLAYTLVMLPKFGKHIPVLVPMFRLINQLYYKKEKLTNAAYFVVGQVCVAKAYRGQGLFKQLYEQLEMHMKNDFDFMITEVAARNTRSLAAHTKYGFQSIHQYQSDLGEDWHIILKQIG